jgi:hypothetical protein
MFLFIRQMTWEAQGLNTNYMLPMLFIYIILYATYADNLATKSIKLFDNRTALL